MICLEPESLFYESIRKAAIKAAYEARRDRQTNPDGDFDDAGRWYPSPEEDADDIAGYVRSPSRAWPYSYMLRARTKRHVTVLVDQALAGRPVPADIARAIEGVALR